MMKITSVLLVISRIHMLQLFMCTCLIQPCHYIYLVLFSYGMSGFSYCQYAGTFHNTCILLRSFEQKRFTRVKRERVRFARKGTSKPHPGTMESRLKTIVFLVAIYCAAADTQVRFVCDSHKKEKIGEQNM